ncbi:hypothetical protein BKA67DRAFT_527690 [Truncatella angustata]|uniref:Uncharacterized protein n=1 Tax=Truncatella angustata TaxID=152316 RepID=A0A9P8RFE8_9PEZI|nr:uncharacterized protein BKA67DRAFT_527690 [Truncatella angustata]KAH6645023.1 hypothetical protein BKA67DRAFT_527690 [Truncatella angustata]
MIPRKPVASSLSQDKEPRRTSAGYTTTLVATALLAVFVAIVPWARRWVLSGAAVETLLLLHASGSDSKRILPSMPLWTLLSTLNLTYAICSTSWLLNGLFIAFIYPVVFFTSVAQFPAVASLCRKCLRKALGKDPHFISYFIRDQLALFNLPALEIDTEVNGLFVIRGVTISLSTLTIVAHGIEVGIKITNDIELALCVDEVTVKLFRHIDIGDVYANVKGGKFEMTLGDVDNDLIDDNASVDSAFLGDTPLLRAATVGSEGFRDRPKLRESLTGGASFMRDSSAQDGFDGVTKLSPDDELADKEYRQRLTDIRTTSPIYQSRQEARSKAAANLEPKLKFDKDIRAAISAELHSMPSIAHAPSRSVRVTTLQTLSPPHVRRFMHRLPFLLRLLLAPLSYFHPISIASINAAGSGQWVSELLQQEVFRHYLDKSAELRRLHRRVSTWLTDATFCVQLTDVDGLGSVPLTTAYDIIAYLRFKDVMAYRNTQEFNKITQVVRLGGADATFTIPSYLLPHHEHLLPPRPTRAEKEEFEIEVTEADGIPQAVQAEKDLEKIQKDESAISMSVHASLPAAFDQTLLNFIAALVKATKIIELEKDLADVEQKAENSAFSTIANIDDAPTSPISDTASETESINTLASDTSTKAKPGMKDVAGFKMMARNIRQNLKDGTYNSSIKELAKELHQSTNRGMKKAMVGGLINDRWIAKLVGKTAAALQKAQGDVGYSGEIPISLAPYRGSESLPSKLLP